MERSYRELLLSYDNLAWAWKKAKALYARADGPVDAAEIAAFELNLEAALNQIIRDFQNGTYRLSPIILLPQPKKRDENGRPRMRESFHIAVRDQVAWIALVNVIGPELDIQMPKWSYGHRLYKSAWYEEVDDNRRLSTGPYRHTSGNLYRKWQHSWPLFRRHISLTSRLMVGGRNALTKIRSELDEAEISALDADERPDYLSTNWPKIEGKTLYYASIDLAKFYPTIKHRAILSSLSSHLPAFESDRWLKKLIRNLLDFKVDEQALLLKVNSEPPTRVGKYPGVPTGLMVAGFLSNVAMLPLDLEADKRRKKNRTIAHFRFVDDHAIIASDQGELIEWVRWYRKRLSELRIGPIVSRSKYEPPLLREVVESRKVTKEKYEKLAKASAIDGSNPTKLLTRTLALVSTLATLEFDTISIHSKKQRVDELVWLLMANLPDIEIRSDTRVSFAASRLTALVPRMMLTSDEVLHWGRQVSDVLRPQKGDKKSVRLRKAQYLLRAKKELADARAKDRAEKARMEARYFKLLFRTFIDHVDKPRLFLRLVQYCRVTGYNGLPEIFEWLETSENEDFAALKSYLKIVAIQALTKQVVECAYQLGNPAILRREWEIAWNHLSNLGSLQVTPKSHGPLVKHPIWKATIQAYGASLRTSALVLRTLRKGRMGLPFEFDRTADQLKLPQITDPTAEWQRSTGWTVGVWAHLFDEVTDYETDKPSAIWSATAPQHNPLSNTDWNNLRKYPGNLPPNARRYVQEFGKRLRPSDGGWLWDYLNSIQNRKTSDRIARTYDFVERHLHEVRSLRHAVTLERWVATTRALDDSDPRASEWTALEIVRQIVASTSTFGVTLDILERLHPSNVFVPRSWIGQNGGRNTGMWTWEAWKRQLADKADVMSFSNHPIGDYRLSHDGKSELSAWERQFRSCGLLLFSLLRKDTQLPSEWNVRGNQRDVSHLVKHQLENMVVSSPTLGILEAALLPRSAETRIIFQFPDLFFGIRSGRELRSNSSDPPIILGPDELLERIDDAQNELSALQISVLDHAPRQLVPMDVVQLRGSAVPIPDDGN